MTLGNPQLVTVRSISLYPEQHATIAQFAADSGLGYSAALRFIIQDWVRLKRAAIHAHHPADDHALDTEASIYAR